MGDCGGRSVRGWQITEPRDPPLGHTSGLRPSTTFIFTSLHLIMGRTSRPRLSYIHNLNARYVKCLLSILRSRGGSEGERGTKFWMMDRDANDNQILYLLRIQEENKTDHQKDHQVSVLPSPRHPELSGVLEEKKFRYWEWCQCSGSLVARLITIKWCYYYIF